MAVAFCGTARAWRLLAYVTVTLRWGWAGERLSLGMWRLAFCRRDFHMTDRKRFLR